MARATYAQLGDACATAHAMELIGGRWSYPILRELMLGPKRFTSLLASVRGITPAVLTARLRELTAAGLVQPATDVEAAPLHAYTLTTWAQQLAPTLRELGRWAQSSPVRSDAGGLTPDAAVQAMITMAEGVSPGEPIHIQLHLVDSRVDADTAHDYHVDWTQDGFRAKRGACTNPPATVRCDSSAWAQVLFADLSLEDSCATTIGEAGTVRTLVDSFRHPRLQERLTAAADRASGGRRAGSARSRPR